MNKPNILLAFPFMALLSGCASAVSGATQQVTVLTPGSSASLCILENGIRYKAESGVPVEIMRSEKDLVVDCYGSNNRNRKILVQSKVNEWSAGNVALGGIPVVYDHFSKAMYEYPEIITVDFIGLGAQGYELPQYHNKDMPNPYNTAIETYTPSTPKLPQDSGYLKRGIEKKSHVMDSNPFTDRRATNNSDPHDSSFSGEVDAPIPANSSKIINEDSSIHTNTKSVVRGTTAEELTRSMNPHVFKQ